ncbi:MAG: N-acetyl sugar amidotransferase [Flavobacteriales bacterium]
MNPSAYKICTRCVMDNNGDDKISFNHQGVCNYCSEAEKSLSERGKLEDRVKQLDTIIAQIKESGKSKKYDCIIGCSGGIDSTFLAYKAKELGLKPLVVHYDNGWNSETSVQNIQGIIKKLGIDLYTHVNDWEEFKDIQGAFFKANVLDIELITDQAILCILLRMAKKHKIKYLITGHNVESESILPENWYHLKIDSRNIWGIHQKFGTVRMRTYPIMFFNERYRIDKYTPVKTIHLLNYLHYNKKEARALLEDKLGWKDYGGKHFESIFTRFYQGYILPKKFNIDKRKAHLSSLIISNQITRQEALEELQRPPYSKELMEEDKNYVIKKLGFTAEEFDEYISTPPIPHTAYKSYINLHYKVLKFLGKQIP